MKALIFFSLAAALSLGAGAVGREASNTREGMDAQGFWVASTPAGVAVKWGILDNGETWGIYEAQAERTILGAFHGQTRSANGVLHGTGQAFDIPTRTIGEASYTGTYLAKTAISITTSSGLGFSGHYVAGYDQPASLSALAGDFGGEALSARSPVQDMGLHVSGSGAMSFHSPQGCTASGTATPRPGGKNVFNVALRFAGAACALGDGASVSGVAHHSQGSGELFVLAMNESETDGWMYLGWREPGQVPPGSAGGAQENLAPEAVDGVPR
jgi:hypothetical protein